MTTALMTSALPTTTTTSAATTSAPTGVTGGPRVLLRLEGAAVLVLAAAAYDHLGAAGWGLFLACFLAPDLAFLGYLGGPRLGAAAYNATHSYVGPVVVGAIGVALGAPLMIGLALIWAAHVGFDRMLGYGLKYESAFGHTHLGRVGRRA